MSDRNEIVFSHEKLDAYHVFLEFAGLSESAVVKAGTYAVANQLERATESIGANLVRGNSQWTQALRATAFDVSMASALECAACLDVCSVKRLIEHEIIENGKGLLHRIVRMLFGLRKRKPGFACEDEAPYGTPLFDHERLDVYRQGLDFVRWVDGLTNQVEVRAQEVRKLDANATSIVLNTAEGNGRFGRLDRTRFIDIAHSSALQCALVLDLMVARSRLSVESVASGKALLIRICSLLMGWRRKLGAMENRERD